MKRHYSAGGLLLSSLKKSGIDFFFINSGTEYASLLIDYKHMDKESVPRMIVSLHESTAVAAAYGYALKKDKPSAVLVHTVPGVANSLSNIINAHSANIPLVLISGITPFSNEGYTGSRNIRVHWGQDVQDILGIIQQFVKWSYVVKSVSEVPLTVSRAVEIALSPPQGPVYIGIYREWLMEKVEQVSYVKEPSSVMFPVAENSVIKDVAERMLEAEFPVVLTRSAGRWVENVGLLARLADIVSCRVNYAVGDYVNFPTTNPFSTPFNLRSADFILVIETDVPWIPSVEKPREDAYKIHVGLDPLKTSIGILGFNYDKVVQAHSIYFLQALLKEVKETKNRLDKDVVEERRSKAMNEWSRIRKEKLEEIGSDIAHGRLTKRLASHILGKIIKKDTVIVNEYSLRPDYMEFENAGTYFGEPPAGALGWGLGAALGIKLAEPIRDVVAVVGDGSYVFNNPLSAHYMSRWYNLPILIVVFNDGRWSDVKRSVLDTGFIPSFEEIGVLEGVDFPEVIEIGKQAEAAGLTSYTVSEITELENSLSKAFAEVRKGRAALVDVRISSRANLS